MATTRIGFESLGMLCDNLGVAFDVGINPHKALIREAEKGSVYGRTMSGIAEDIESGRSLADSFRAQGKYFPKEFTEMIEAGEKSGRLDTVLDRLAIYYKQAAEFRSTFISSLAWPLVQLVIGIIVVGVIIFVPAELAPEGFNADLLGVGLTGAIGLSYYIVIVGLVLVGIFALYKVGQAGKLNFLVEIASGLPMIGPVLRVFPESRFVNTLSLSTHSGVDIWTAVEMAFRAAGTPRFLSRIEKVQSEIMEGRELQDVLGRTNLFSKKTIDVVESGENAGRLAEVLERYYDHLKQEVRKSMSWLSQAACTLIWLAIGGLLIFVIFRVFTLYVGTVTDIANGVTTGEIPIQF